MATYNKGYVVDTEVYSYNASASGFLTVFQASNLLGATYLSGFFSPGSSLSTYGLLVTPVQNSATGGSMFFALQNTFGSIGLNALNSLSNMITQVPLSNASGTYMPQYNAGQVSFNGGGGGSVSMSFNKLVIPKNWYVQVYRPAAATAAYNLTRETITQQ